MTMSESASDSLTALKKLKVAELREQLSAIGLPINGLKSDLVDRLFKALHPEQIVADIQNVAKKVPAEVEIVLAPESIPMPAPSPKKNLEPVGEGLNTETPSSADNFQELKRKRSERFGMVFAESSNGQPVQSSKLDSALGVNKRSRQKKGDSAPKLNLNDPDVQRRLNRFGLQMHDSNSVVAKSVAAEEAQRKKEERLKRFANVKDDNPDIKDFQAAVAARKARFGTA